MKKRQKYRFPFVSYALFCGLFFAAISLVTSGLVAGGVIPEQSRVRLPTIAAGRSQPQKPTHIYAVSSDVIAIEIAAPDVKLAKQMGYNPQPEDELVKRNGRSHVKRNGKFIGLLVGPHQDVLYTYDEVDSTSFRKGSADQAGRYAISSCNDSNYLIAKQPTAVWRKTKPVALSRQAEGVRRWPAAHTLYLALPQPMATGKTYRLAFFALGVQDTPFTYQPTETRSEAVHISQLGFRPTDPFKAGYLSAWMGNGGGVNYPDTLPFRLIEARSNKTVYRGQSARRRRENQSEDPRNQDYTLSEVHQLDFSEFARSGTYRLCVDSVGCSFDFEIDSKVWDEAFYTAARGFYHQRSGIEIGAPHSEFVRPRAFHPDDGVKVYQSETTLLEVDMGLGEQDAFETLVARKTEVEVPDAWGGYFDAADWDRRIQHLTVPRNLLELYTLFPEHFKSKPLNLPESDNALPDIVDEALWSIDFFRRLQTSEGGIRGGVESAAHPQWGEGSWQESLTVMAYAPDVWSSYLYAGVAARAANVLMRYDEPLAERYESSALRAMVYAESRYVSSDYVEGKKLHQVKDDRNLAALELYRLTGDRQWHDLFLETTVFTDPTAEVFVHGQQSQRDAAFLYAQLASAQPASRSAGDSPLQVDTQVQANAKAALLRAAERQVMLTRTTAFGWSRRDPDAPVGWRNGLGAPTAIDILRAHALTGRDDYLQAGISSTQFAAGANPANLVFTTGMGDRSPQNPLIIDQRITGQSPPPGITLFGPADFDFYKDYWLLNVIATHTFPKPRQWPIAENYFDIYSNPIGAEFTVHYMADSAYTWGYLAARESATESE